MLARQDFDSPTWKRLMAHVEQRMATLRAELERFDMDRPQTDHARTLILRARLSELKELQALAAAPAVDPAGDARGNLSE